MNAEEMEYYFLESDLESRHICWNGSDADFASLDFVQSFWKGGQPTNPPPLRFCTLAEMKEADGKLGKKWFLKGGGDCPFFSSPVLIMSERAVEILGSFFNGQGRFYPFETELGVYAAFQCTSVIDPIDASRSTIQHYSNGLPKKITKYVFRDEIPNVPVFRMPWPPQTLIVVSAAVVAEITKTGLNGFLPVKLS